MLNRIERGQERALGASFILIMSAVCLLGISLLALHEGRVTAEGLSPSSLSLFAIILYLATVVGTALAIMALAFDGCRARWFWTCLTLTAGLWLFAPPLLTMIGLVSLILLLRARKNFPQDATQIAAPALEI